MPQHDFGTFTIEETSVETKDAKNWNVIIHDSDQHSFAYVTKLLQEVFAKNQQDAELLTLEVHQMGLAIVKTCSKERAELYKEQVTAYGADEIMQYMGKTSNGSIGCSIEQAE
jgi:ATP-dependent Clp protease adaptor protein ClpS